MALYFYQAFSKDGKKVSNYVDASSVQAVKTQLSSQGLFPVSITLATERRQRFFWVTRLFARSVPVKTKILFTRQLSVLLKSGIPLLQSLELLTEYFEGSFQSTVVEIKDTIKEGQSFAQALARYPKTFDTIYIQLVRAGEASGNLETILDRLADFMERRETIKKKVMSALRMPIIQIIVAVSVVTLLLVKAVPGMVETFTESGKELPTSTAILIGISNVFVSYYLIILALLGILTIVYLYWSRTPSGARTIDQIKLKIPIVKYFTRMNAVVQFSYTLGLLREGGVNLAQALDIVCKIVNNRILADTLIQARDKIIKQGNIAQYLKNTGLFPPIAIYLIKTGEESGKLDSMLLTVARNYEEELSELTDSLTTSLGPAITIVMALVVGFIVMAMAMPMFESMDIQGL